jgi:hypothetical protein
MYAFIPIQILVREWARIEDSILHPFFFGAEARQRGFRVVDAVWLRRDVERYPHASIPARRGT